MNSAEGSRGVLEPVIAGSRGTVKRRYFRGDAAFANPEVYEFLESEGMGKIGHLLERRVGRPPHEVRRYYASFGSQAESWKKLRRVLTKIEWHPGELYPRGRLYRHQPGAAGRACDGLLQPARHRGAVVQRRKAAIR